ncbi:hypothetical protein DL93DRAFT_672695 [Clavulina sp. PMI_390]|nr:hypothetical protein DL93DRAFT_672695 [Clavulina sp. PMI_390]
MLVDKVDTPDHLDQKETTDVPPAYVRAPDVNGTPLPTEPSSLGDPSRPFLDAPLPPLPPLEPVEPTKIFTTPPTNYVSLRSTRDSVKGSWTIDSTLARPPFLRPAANDPSSSTPPTTPSTPQEPKGFFSKLFRGHIGTTVQDKYNGPEPHLKLYSTYSRVEANVRVVRGSRISAPARIDARSIYGSVKLNIASRGAQRLNIVAVSGHETVEILLPRDFRGLVRHRTQWGSYKPSQAVASQSNTFSVEKGVGTSFIGNWSEIDFSRWKVDFADDNTSSGSDDWPADMLTVEATYENIKIKYNDE